MLYELFVENIALIREMRLPLSDGMNALTGETGAGKSLIIDALSLLIGGRSNDELIRSGADKAAVEGVFLPPFPSQLSELCNDDFSTEDSIILRRELIRGGRSVARINGRVTTLGRLREVGRQLVNIHGQNEHILLLEEERQLALLDSFGGSDCLQAAAEVRNAFQQLRAAKLQLKQYEEQQEQRADEMLQLQDIIEEISNANCKLGEIETLNEEAHLLAHAERLHQLTSSARDVLYDSAGVVEKLNEAAAIIRQAADFDAALDELAERINSLYYEAEDVTNVLSSYRSRINMDAYRQEEIEARLSALGKLCKKHGGSIEMALQRLEQAEQRYRQLEEISISGDAFREQASLAGENYRQAAAKLREIRSRAAARLGLEITEQIRDMAMPNAVFRVDLTDCVAGEHGTEQAQFMICANIGEEYLPVSKIASGGELSRIVLGIKVILSRLDAVPTLIFDEIDTGMSGQALVAVARRVALVSRETQTISVSHSAVMAAAADNQIRIEKHEESGRTIIDAQTLDEEQRIAELARMIAGDQAGAVTLQQAQELLQRMHN